MQLYLAFLMETNGQISCKLLTSLDFPDGILDRAYTMLLNDQVSHHYITARHILPPQIKWRLDIYSHWQFTQFQFKPSKKITIKRGHTYLHQLSKVEQRWWYPLSQFTQTFTLNLLLISIPTEYKLIHPGPTCALPFPLLIPKAPCWHLTQQLSNKPTQTPSVETQYALFETKQLITTPCTLLPWTSYNQALTTTSHQPQIGVTTQYSYIFNGQDCF